MMKIELKKFSKLWNIAKVYIQIQMVCVDFIRIRSSNSNRTFSLIWLLRIVFFLFTDFSEEEEDEFIMAEENNHEGGAGAGDDDIDQEDIRNLHIDG